MHNNTLLTLPERNGNTTPLSLSTARKVTSEVPAATLKVVKSHSTHYYIKEPRIARRGLPYVWLWSLWPALPLDLMNLWSKHQTVIQFRADVFFFITKERALKMNNSILPQLRKHWAYWSQNIHCTRKMIKTKRTNQRNIRRWQCWRWQYWIRCGDTRWKWSITRMMQRMGAAALYSKASSVMKLYWISLYSNIESRWLYFACSCLWSKFVVKPCTSHAGYEYFVTQYSVVWLKKFFHRKITWIN